MTDKITERRYQILKGLIHFIEDYYKAHSIPVPMRVLSLRFARPLIAIGDDFRETVRNLRLDGSVQAVLRRSGRLDFYPAGVDLNEEGTLPADAVKRPVSS